MLLLKHNTCCNSDENSGNQTRLEVKFLAVVLTFKGSQMSGFVVLDKVLDTFNHRKSEILHIDALHPIGVEASPAAQNRAKEISVSHLVSG